MVPDIYQMKKVFVVGGDFKEQDTKAVDLEDVEGGKKKRIEEQMKPDTNRRYRHRVHPWANQLANWLYYLLEITIYKH